MNRPDLSFLDMPAPAGYVPGLGRGATGFTTRSDIGPARTGVDGGGEEDEERYRDPENDSGLFAASGQQDEEDNEADKIYEAIDARMAERRKAQREQREKLEKEEYDRANPKISSQFTDLKRQLSSVSSDEWLNIPEVGDLTRKRKRQRQEENAERRFYAVPDTVMAGVRDGAAVEASIDPNEGGAGTVTDFRAISSAKDRMLELKLDQSEGSGTATSIDPKGYLTSLAGTGSSSSSIPSATEIGDIRRVRPLLESMVKTDPKEPRAWIGLARLEELAQRINKARSVIQKGCDNCSRSPDVWLENMRLNDKATAKVIAAKAVKYNPKSIDLWMAAMKLEDDDNSKTRVIQKALESNPQSDTLWKELINMQSNPSEAIVLLSKAVELVPLSEDLWLALARLETPKNARKVLQRARKQLRVSRAVWIAAARLEEQDKGPEGSIDKIMVRGIRDLEKEGGLPNDRTQWILDAELCEKEGAVLTCHAIIKATIGLDVEPEDRESVWMDDARSSIERGAHETARAIYSHALESFPASHSLWLAIVELEKKHGQSKDKLWEMFEKAVSACGNSEVFWRMYARELWHSGDADGARNVFARAYKSNPNSEGIWLDAVDLELENHQDDVADKLLLRARTEAGTEQIWIRSIIYSRRKDDLQGALELISQALEQFPASEQLYLQQAQIYQLMENRQSAMAAYQAGTKACPKSIKLWTGFARLEQEGGVTIKARSILDRAALVNEKSELLWLERVRLEEKVGNHKQANVLMAKALQECPNSGLLWSEYMWMLPRIDRRTKIVDALKATDNSPYVLTTAGRNFWSNGQAPKAKRWLENAVKTDPSIGDSWIWLYKFAQEMEQDDVEAILQGFQQAEPTDGHLWVEHLENASNFGLSKVEILKKAVSLVQQ